MTSRMLTRERARELDIDVLWRSIGARPIFGPVDWLDALELGAPTDWCDWILWHSKEPWAHRRLAIEPRFRVRKHFGEWIAEWVWLGLLHTITIDAGWDTLARLVRAEYARQLAEWEAHVAQTEAGE